MTTLAGKVIAITGAASGIGLTVANLAAQHGAKLALADLNSDELAKVVESLRLAGTDAIGTVVNVASSQDVDKWVGSIIEHFGRLDGAANMAGVEGKMSNTSALSDENWNSVISVNLTGLMYCIRAQVRVMKDKGSIVNAASIAGLRGGSGMSAYSASKHGVIGLTKSVAKEEGVRGIRVNAVAPGPTQTPMLERISQAGIGTGLRSFSSATAAAPLQRAGEVEEVAAPIVFLLSDSASYITGVVFPVDGGAMS